MWFSLMVKKKKKKRSNSVARQGYKNIWEPRCYFSKDCNSQSIWEMLCCLMDLGHSPEDKKSNTSCCSCEKIFFDPRLFFSYVHLQVILTAAVYYKQGYAYKNVYFGVCRLLQHPQAFSLLADGGAEMPLPEGISRGRLESSFHPGFSLALPQKMSFGGVKGECLFFLREIYLAFEQFVGER